MTNVNCDRDNLDKEVRLLLAQRNIYCNSAKRLYAKLTALHHSSEISKEQHRKLLPFLEIEREKVDVVSYDCENTIAQFDKIPDDRFVGIVSKAATILGKYLTRLCMVLLGCLQTWQWNRIIVGERRMIY